HAGHQVSVTARDSAKAAEVAAANPGSKAVAAANAAAEADAIVLATGYADAVGALKSVGDLKGKVIIDITNPLTADYMGLTIGHTTSAGEEIAKAVPGAELVKAFNTLFAQVLAEGADFGAGRKATVFYAGDSERAKQAARVLAESLGFETIDAGGLKNARYLESLAGLNIYLGYGAGLGTGIAPTWLRKA
ncbi:MAG: NAD(P)-binding domain-containing protein, partial [Rhizobacter sp.]|nr:NAD(P)-binding domain-containing protein [Rhizobacter sp.]